MQVIPRVNLDVTVVEQAKASGKTLVEKEWLLTLETDASPQMCQNLPCAVL